LDSSRQGGIGSSSYQAYAYGKRTPKWLNTDMILSQFINVEL
jgi:hypothetical protein